MKQRLKQWYSNTMSSYTLKSSGFMNDFKTNENAFLLKIDTKMDSPYYWVLLFYWSFAAALAPFHPPAPLWPSEPIIRLHRSELCGSPSPAQKSVVKQKHGLFTGFRFPCRCLWPGIVAMCQAGSKWTGSRTQLKRAIVFPRSDVIRNICTPSTLKREACLTGFDFIEHNFNGRLYYTI